MKKTALRYGGMAAIICGVISGSMFLVGGRLDYGTSEILGWVAIILGLSMVFFGIRYYRDKQSDGTITLGKSMQVGLLISLFPSVIFFIVTLIVFTTYGEEFSNTLLNTTKRPPRRKWTISASNLKAACTPIPSSRGWSCS